MLPLFYYKEYNMSSQVRKAKTLDEAKDIELMKKLSDYKYNRRSRQIELTIEEKRRIMVKKLKAVKGFGETIVNGDKVYRRIKCLLCGRWHEYDVALKPYYVAQGRWNFYFDELDACLKDDLCKEYQYRYRVHKMKEANVSQQVINKYNPNSHNLEINSIKRDSNK